MSRNSTQRLLHRSMIASAWAAASTAVCLGQTITFYGSDTVTPSFSVFDFESEPEPPNQVYNLGGSDFDQVVLDVIDITEMVPGTKFDLSQEIIVRCSGAMTASGSVSAGIHGELGSSGFFDLSDGDPGPEFFLMGAGPTVFTRRTAVSSESLVFAASVSAMALSGPASASGKVQGFGATRYAYEFVPSDPYTGGDWEGGGAETTLPDGPGVTGVFPASAAGTVSVSGARTVGNWLIDGSSAYTFTGPGSITLSQGQSVPAPAQVSVDGVATHAIHAQITLASDTSFHINSSAQLSIGGTLSIGTNSGAIAKMGAGTLSIPATAIDTLQVGEGRLKLNTSGTVTRVSHVAIAGEAKNSSGTTAFSGGALDISVSGSGLIVDYDGNNAPSPIGDYNAESTLAYYIKNGYNGGTWEGAPADTSGNKLPVLNSSAAAANSSLAVGFAEASTVLGLSGGTFLGESVDGSTALVRVVLSGDANLDGTVNSSDYNMLAANFGLSDKLWFQGDFNYDGIVNTADFNKLAANFGYSVGPEGPSTEDWANLAAAIPEPTTGAVAVCVFGLPLMRRRR